MDQPMESAILRSTWVHALARETQLFIGAAAEAPMSALPGALERLAEALSGSLNPAEVFAARALLLDSAIAAGSLIHRRVHRPTQHRCSFNPAQAALLIWHRHPASPARFLQEWGAAIWIELGRDQEILWQARAWAAQQWRESRSSAEAGIALGMRASTIDRVFRRTLGMSFSKYHRGVRLVRALELLAATELKVDAVAAEVGFRSKKNFYRSFREWTGVTPRQFRADGLRLPDEAIGGIPPVFQRQVQTALRPRARGPLAIGTVGGVTARRVVRLQA
jgi:AraC-like DNA-binding protein